MFKSTTKSGTNFDAINVSWDFWTNKIFGGTRSTYTKREPLWMGEKQTKKSLHLLSLKAARHQETVPTLNYLVQYVKQRSRLLDCCADTRDWVATKKRRVSQWLLLKLNGKFWTKTQQTGEQITWIQAQQVTMAAKESRSLWKPFGSASSASKAAPKQIAHSLMTSQIIWSSRFTASLSFMENAKKDPRGDSTASSSTTSPTTTSTICF